MKLYLILFFVTLAKLNASKIVFDISADHANPTVSFTGTGIRNATPRDIRHLFLIDKKTMKGYIGNYYNNTVPRKVLYSPSSTQNKKTVSSDDSRQGDVHKRFNWDPVTLVSSVKSAWFKAVMPGSSIHFSRNFKNPTNETKKVDAGIQMPVAITLETEWSTTPDSDDDYEPEYDFVYEVNANFKEDAGTSRITHTRTFGRSIEELDRVTIGRKNYELELKPGQAVISKFSARVSNLVMKAVVVTSVTGNLAVNFNEPIEGRYWLGPKIEDVLSHVNRSTVSHVEENLTLKLNFYYDVKVELFDEKTGLPWSD